jgi:hypothetical protein
MNRYKRLPYINSGQLILPERVTYMYNVVYTVLSVLTSDYMYTLIKKVPEPNFML